MKKKTLKALKLSIAHWERMATGNQWLGEKPDGTCCALCERFNSARNDCVRRRKRKTESCPLAKKSTFCKGTPFYYAFFEWDRFYFSDKFRKLAKLELEFLQSILPKKD